MKLNFPGCCRERKLRPIKPAPFCCNSFQAGFGTGKNMAAFPVGRLKTETAHVVKALINN